MSPDLTRAAYDVPASLGAFTALDPEKGTHRGVIYTIAPSFTRPNLIWVGTDDGLIHVTHDGGRKWTNVTPTALTPWSKVSLMEASHVDTLAVYAAVNRFRLDDLHPHIFRTKDGGRTWTDVVEGILSNEVVNAVREDPVRRGLVYAGTERGVCVSFDAGDHWQSPPRRRPPTGTGRRPPFGSAETRTPTRRCRPTSPQRRTRRTARSLTTIWLARPPHRSRSRFSIGREGWCAVSRVPPSPPPPPPPPSDRSSRTRRSTFPSCGSGRRRRSPPRGGCTASCG